MVDASIFEEITRMSQLLDWDDALPEEHLQRAETDLRGADLAMCLGTSLRIKPASELPLLCTKNGGKLVICNLQATPKDGHAHIIVRTQVDNFFQGVMALLDLPIPPATRSIRLMAGAERVVNGNSKQLQGHGLPPISDPLHQQSSDWEVGVWSVAGKDCPVPLIKSVSLRAEASCGRVDTLAVLTKPPFTVVMPCSPTVLLIEMEPTLPNGKTMSMTLDLTESMLREVMRARPHTHAQGCTHTNTIFAPHSFSLSLSLLCTMMCTHEHTSHTFLSNTHMHSTERARTGGAQGRGGMFPTSRRRRAQDARTVAARLSIIDACTSRAEYAQEA